MEPAIEDHRLAQGAFSRVLSGVRDDQLAMPTPCTQWKVGDLVDHVVAGNRRIGGLDQSPLPDSVEAIRRDHELAARSAQSTFEAPDGMTRTFELPFGTIPGSVFIGLRTTDVLVHAWDLAAATGQPTDIEPDLSERMLAVARERVQPAFRGEGRPFGEEQPCDPDRPAADRLAAFLGRRVS
ncbi:MAG TPA: TIGR03086 family metal-binding protein [Acidimicrobiales bacterium]|nr:TIGR03086 family metal-binding protein [Acidimicrobiales bacterium]